MQIRTRVIEGGDVHVEVIDPTDGAVTHSATVGDGEQIVVVATDTHSPAGIEFGEVEAIPTAEASDEQTEAAAAQAGEGEPQAEAPEGDAGDASDGTPAPEGDGEAGEGEAPAAA